MISMKLALSRAALGAAAALTFSALAAPAIAFADAPCTGAVGTPIVDVTQAVSNDPDSGNLTLDWATDTYTKHMQVWLDSDGSTYCGQTTDTGTFTTNATISPELGSPLPQAINGTFTGGARYVIAGDFLGASSTWPTSDSVPANTCGGINGTACPFDSYSGWIAQYFSTPGHTFVSWGWTYATLANGTWINQGDNDSQNDIGDLGIVVNNSTHIGYPTLQAAVDAATPGDTITLSSDVTTSSEVSITKALTIDGAGHTLHAPFAKTDNSNNAAIGILHSDVTIKNLIEDGAGSTGSRHGINIFEAVANVNLNDVTVENNAASGITINGSTVTVNNITTKANAWGGINVDKEADAPDATVLTVTGTSVQSETGPDIWRDDNSKNVTVTVNSQYASQTYTSAPSVTGTIWGLTSTTVTTAAQLNAALTNPLVATITFGSDITTNAELDITRAVTIDGAGHSIKTTANGGSVIQITANNVTIKNLVEDGTGTTGNRGINIYVVTGIQLTNVTAENNAKNGIVVNGSTVTATSITTAGNGWEGIDVDLGGGVTSPASLTVNGVSAHTGPKAAIRIDDITKAVSVIDTNNQYTATDTGNTRDYVLNGVQTKTSSATTQTSTGGGVSVTFDIPAGATVSGDASWDGTIVAPTATLATVTISGFTTSVSSAVTIGSSDSDLTFSNAVKLTFPGLAGQRVGSYNHAGTFTEITDTCDSLTAPTLADGAACKIDSGTDLIVWTKHFSTFVTYTASPLPTGSGGGSSGGGGGVGSISPVTTTTIPVTTTTPTITTTANPGQVLGAETFNFSANLSRGSKSASVTALQQFLISEGYSIPAGATGYFGVQTFASVKAFQKANGVPNTGFVGVLTRKVLNVGVISTTPEKSAQ